MSVDFDFVRACESDLHQISGLERRDKIPPIAIRVSDEERYRRHEPLGEGTDTLGKYLYQSPNTIITLFDMSIYAYAACTRLEATLAAKIVLIHEIAHSVTHLGCLDGKIWENFGKTAGKPDSLEEHFAQVATWLYIDMINSKPLLRTFEQMLDNSPTKYKTWKEVVNAGPSVEDVRQGYRSTLWEESGRMVSKSDLTKDIE
jgi:hypothetical protein